jgi:manganese/zinc/iron transport system ATP- binding protein
MDDTKTNSDVVSSLAKIPYKQANQLAMDSLKKLNMEQYANTLNSRLSGGTKRKALIATATASEAEIIFLDEPMTGNEEAISF